MKSIDVTKKVDFGFNDDEYLPITKCICGAEFDAWKFIISIYEDGANACPVCGRRFYFRPFIKVYEILTGENYES